MGMAGKCYHHAESHTDIRSADANWMDVQPFADALPFLEQGCRGPLILDSAAIRTLDTYNVVQRYHHLSPKVPLSGKSQSAHGE